MARWAKNLTKGFIDRVDDLSSRPLPNVGKSAGDLANFMKENAGPALSMLNSKPGYITSIGIGAALTPLGYAKGERESERRHKMNQVEGNMETSSDGGGTFLRPNFTPAIDDHAATGELVFAMRSLRNGG